MSLPRAPSDLVLPYKLVFAGAVHVSAPCIVTNALPRDVVRSVNERLLEQDDLAFYGEWMPGFVAAKDSLRLLSTWLTAEQGLVVVKDPVLEYALRIYRALARRMALYDDALARTDLKGHAKRFFELCADWTRGESLLLPPLLSVLRGVLRDLAHGDPELRYFDINASAIEAEQRWQELDGTLSRVSVFWGLDRIHALRDEAREGADEMPLPGPPAHISVREAPACDSYEAYGPKDARALQTFLHSRYGETLGGLGHPVKVTCRRMRLTPHDMACHAADLELYHERSGLVADLEAFAVLRDTHWSTLLRRARFSFGLYLLLGNGFEYRFF